MSSEPVKSTLADFAKDMADLQTKYPDKLNHFLLTARHVEGTENCMVMLPCSYKDKKISILVAEV